MKLINLALIVALLSVSIQCGQVASYDLELMYKNAGAVTSIKIQFSLDNAISISDFIKIDFPELVGAGSTGTLAGGQTGTVTLSTNGNTVYATGKAFAANIIYQLTIPVSGQLATAGVRGVVGISTVSSSGAEQITYDSNPMFTILTLAPVITTLSSGISKTYQLTSTEPTLMGSINRYFVDFTSDGDYGGFPDASILGFQPQSALTESEFKGVLSDTNYKASGCNVTSKVCAATDTGCTAINIPASTSSCTLVANTFSFKVKSKISKNQVIRIALDVTAPYLVGATGLTITHVSPHNLIYQIKNLAALQSAIATTVTVNNPKFLWGIQIAATQDKGCPIGLYVRQKDNRQSLQPVVNNLQFSVTVAQSIPGGTDYEIFGKFTLGLQTYINGILEGSIYTINFPKIETNTKVICTSKAEGTIYIYCRGIKSLATSTEYTIGARVFGSNVGGGTVDKYAVKATPDSLDANGYYNQQKVSAIFTAKQGTQGINSIVTGADSGLAYDIYQSDQYYLTGTEDIQSYSSQTFGKQWVQFVKTTNTVNQVATALGDVLADLCLALQNTYQYQTISAATCKTKYGTFLISGTAYNRILLYVYQAGTGIIDTDNTANTGNIQAGYYIVHKFLLHSSYVDSATSANGFGAFVRDYLLGNVKKTAGAPTEGPVIIGNTIQAAQNTAGLRVQSSGSKSWVMNTDATATPVVLNAQVNYHEVISSSSMAVITISCQITNTGDLGDGTAANENCLFKKSSRGAWNANDQLGLVPAFEIINNNANNVLKSSLYADENVRDVIYCSYWYGIKSANAAEMITNALAMINLTPASKTATTIKLVYGSLLNFYHIDAPSTTLAASTIAIEFINALCSSGNVNTFNNDGAYIPIFLRLKYNLATAPTTAAGIFFKGEDSIFELNSNKIFDNSFTGTAPESVSVTHHVMTSNLNNVLVEGFSYIDLSGAGTEQVIHTFNWNYWPSIIVHSSASTNDVFVAIKDAALTTTTSCQKQYQFDQVVAASLSRGTGIDDRFTVQVANIQLSYIAKKGTDNNVAFNSPTTSKTVFGGILTATAFAPAYYSYNAHANKCFGATSALIDNYPLSAATAGNYKIGASSLQMNFGSIANQDACQTVGALDLATNGLTTSDERAGSALTIVETMAIGGSSIFDAPTIVTANSPGAEACNAVTIKSTAFATTTAFDSLVYVCPFQRTVAAGATYSSSNLKINIKKVPFYAGNIVTAYKHPFQSNLYFGWSKTSSLLASTSQQYKTAAVTFDSNSCSATGYDQVFNDIKFQKTGFTFTPNADAPISLPVAIRNAATTIVTTGQSIALVSTLAALQGSPTSLECQLPSANNLDCTAVIATNVITYTLTKKAAATTATVSGAVKIDFYLRFTNTQNAFTSTHTSTTGTFKFDGTESVNIYSCSMTTNTFNSKSGRGVNSYVSESFSQQGGAMSPISLTFNFNGIADGLMDYSGLISADITLNNLFDAGNTADNVKCYFLKGSVLSTDFATLTSTISSGTVFARLKQFTASPSTYTMKCDGTIAPTTWTSKPTFMVNANTNHPLGDLQTSTTASAGTVLAANTGTTSTVTAKFYTAGHLAHLTFDITFQNLLVVDLTSTTGISMIQIYFPTTFSPKLSEQGTPTCYISGLPVLCQVNENYRLDIKPSANTVSTAKNVVIEVNGVYVPNVYATLKSFYFQLVQNGVITDQFTSTCPTVNLLPSAANDIQVLFYNVSNTQIRGKANHAFYINLAKDVYDKNNTNFYVQFPEAYAWTIYQRQKGANGFIGCQLKDEDNVNYLSNCTTVGDRTIKVNTISPGNVIFPANKIFFLLIQDLNTPQNAVYLQQFPIFFTTSSTSGEPLLKLSGNGYTNTSGIQFNNPTTYLLNWVDSLGNRKDWGLAYKSYFKSWLWLSLPATISTSLNQQVTSPGFKFTPQSDIPGTSFASKFKIWQMGQGASQTLSFNTGLNMLAFQIAALDQFYNGYDVLDFTLADSNNLVSQIAKLPIVVSEAKITLPVIGAQTIPLAQANSTSGTRSLPLVIEFKDYMPLNAITITGVLQSPTSNSSELSKFSLNPQTQTITNNFDLFKTQATFIVSAQSTATSISSVNLNLTLSGLNVEGYRFNNGQKSVLVSYTMGPSITTNALTAKVPIVTSSAGLHTAQFECSNPSNIYYYFALASNYSAMTQGSIKQATFDIGIQISMLNENSYNGQIFGYALQGSTVSIQVPFNNLAQAKKEYMITYYCEDQMGQITTGTKGNWTQADNNAKNILISLKLGGIPTAADVEILQKQIQILLLAKNSQVVSQNNTKIVSSGSTTTSRRLERSLQSVNQTYDQIFVYSDNPYSSASDTDKKILLVAGKTLVATGLSVTINSTLNATAVIASVIAPNATVLVKSEFIKTNQATVFYTCNANGWIYSAWLQQVEPNSPTVQQLLQKISFQNKTLDGLVISLCEIGAEKSFNVTGLAQDAAYNLYWVSSTPNIGQPTTEYSTLGNSNTIGFRTAKGSILMTVFSIIFTIFAFMLFQIK